MPRRKDSRPGRRQSVAVVVGFGLLFLAVTAWIVLSWELRLHTGR